MKIADNTEQIINADNARGQDKASKLIIAPDP